MTTIRAIGAGLLAGLAAVPAQADCMRSIVNNSSLTTLVRRDGGPWVAVLPHRSQAIRYSEPGTLEVALVCGRPSGVEAEPGEVVYRSSFDYSAIIDRCYIEIGNGLFEEQLGPGFLLGTRDPTPLTVNVPRQGDIVVGPRAEGRCAATYGEGLRARY